jgi:hypothetical protein
VLKRRDLIDDHSRNIEELLASASMPPQKPAVVKTRKLFERYPARWFQSLTGAVAPEEWNAWVHVSTTPRLDNLWGLRMDLVPMNRALFETGTLLALLRILLRGEHMLFNMRCTGHATGVRRVGRSYSRDV